jgi:hypothetical protein
VCTNCGDQVAHLPDTPIRWSKTESELIGRSHGKEFTADLRQRFSPGAVRFASGELNERSCYLRIG